MLETIKSWLKTADLKASKYILDHLLSSMSEKELLYLIYYRMLQTPYVLTRLLIALAIIVWYIEHSIYSYFMKIILRKTNV